VSRKIDKTDNSNGQRELLEAIEEIESLESEKKAAGEKIKAAYAGIEGRRILVKGHVVTSKAIKQIVKDRSADQARTAELRAEVDRIVKALGDFSDSELGEWAKAQAAANVSARNARPPKALQEPEGETLQ
jgi:uncharacterized protein (UPF0335 family)